MRARVRERAHTGELREIRCASRRVLRGSSHHRLRPGAAEARDTTAEPYCLLGYLRLQHLATVLETNAQILNMIWSDMRAPKHKKWSLGVKPVAWNLKS